MAGISVPNSLAVVGVDNYEAICEHTTPPLTSIEPDFRRGGELAALMLLAATSGKGKWRGERVRTFGPLRVVRRASSRILQGNDTKALAALDLIRRRACPGLTAEEAISDFCGFSHPNSLRKFFRRETGMTMSAWRHRN